MGKNKELEIVIMPDVQAEMDSDPELAEAMRDMFATFRQAEADVKSGKYDTFEDAMEAITGSRPELIISAEEE